ncbi:MAG: FAD:protein FMN transferase [Eubacteriales bacterium]|nr:FAD:protein FMN transferase [Eubacteriales bacterium]
MPITGCVYQTETEGAYIKYSDSFFESFDTVITVVAYAKNENEFSDCYEKIRKRFTELHKLFDIYNEYEGINNLKTINDHAGAAPIAVEEEIIGLLEFALKCADMTGGIVNAAMGSVLEIWHNYREKGINEPDMAALPPEEILQDAARHIDIKKIIVDREKGTVYLSDPQMKIDVGALAKGYATELVVSELQKDGNLISGIISAGGNIRTTGKPLDGVRARWGIGIHDPEKPVLSDGELLDVVYLNNGSVVTSGDYERYYIVDGRRYHHIIDPETLMPGEYFKSVTVVTADSGLADALSTAVFLMPCVEGRAFINSLEDVEAIWVMRDGTVEVTEGLKMILRSYGASGSGQDDRDKQDKP